MEPLPTGTGRIVVDSLATETPARGGIRIVTQPAENDAAASFTPGSVAADMTFTFSAAPGRMLIRPTLPTGWTIKAVRVKGQDVTETGIDFRTGAAPVTDIEVEITNRLTEVTGSARNPRGDPVDDYTVLLFARERERWNGEPRNFALVRPDQQGTFSAKGLAPGDYYAAAVDYLDPADAQDPDLLERLQRTATSFSLIEGESKSLELRVQ
jgi:hypothetical protein